MNHHHTPRPEPRRPELSVLLELAVGPTAPALADASAATRVAVAAESAGFAAVHLRDDVAEESLDPSVLAAFLGGSTQRLGQVLDVPTTRNAPYNVARRVLSLDRALAGRAGIAVRPGVGDEVSEAVAPDPRAAHPVRRWAEYSRLLAALWESFPRESVVADQSAGVFVDDSLLRPPAHVGDFYRVRGPLDGPSSVQGRPVRVLVDADLVDLDSALPHVDAVVVARDHAGENVKAFGAALARTGRRRDEVALLGRIRFTADALATPAARAAEIAAWVERDGLDGVVLAVADSASEETHLALVSVTAHLASPGATNFTLRRSTDTLRAGLGLAPVAPRTSGQEAVA